MVPARVAHEQGIGSRALRSMHINLRKIRKELNFSNRSKKTFSPTDLPFTPRVKKIFEIAYKEGIELGQNYVGSEHLLLGLLLFYNRNRASVFRTHLLFFFYRRRHLLRLSF